MYYNFDQLVDYLNAKGSFFNLTPIEVSTLLKKLPEHLALKVIYSEIAEAFIDHKKDRFKQIAEVSAEYGVILPTDAIEVKNNIDKYLSADNDIFEKSIALLTKSASLEDNLVEKIEVTQEEYDFLKEDYLSREKYELIPKMIILP